MADMPTDPAITHDLFLHVRTVVGVVVGLAIGRLLQGVASLIEHPTRMRIWWVHLGWVAWAMLFVTGFWWWEFQLSHVADWTILKFLFLLLYACFYFLLCVILFPVSPPDRAGFQHYFLEKRHWFFGFIAVVALLDIGDTLLKGAGYLGMLGPGYALYIGSVLAIAVAGILVGTARGHAVIMVCALLTEVGWLAHSYYRLA